MAVTVLRQFERLPVWRSSYTRSMAVTVVRQSERLPLLPTTVGPSRRGILDVPSLGSLGDILLHKSDLPPKDPDFLKVVDCEYFRKKCRKTSICI